MQFVSTKEEEILHRPVLSWPGFENGHISTCRDMYTGGTADAKQPLSNIATGETSQAITPFHYFNFYHKITFITRHLHHHLHHLHQLLE